MAIKYWALQSKVISNGICTLMRLCLRRQRGCIFYVPSNGAKYRLPTSLRFILRSLGHHHLFLVPWHMVYFFDDIDSQVETFNSLFLDVLDEHAPIKRIKIKFRFYPFVTPEIKQLMKTTDRWHRKAIQTNDKLCWNRYRFFRQEVKRELRLAEKIHLRNEIYS